MLLVFSDPFYWKLKTAFMLQHTTKKTQNIFNATIEQWDVCKNKITLKENKYFFF
jgi:hypothetical protein